MDRNSVVTKGLARRSLDTISAAFAAAWPRSVAAKDARRLAGAEYARRLCTVEFLVDLPPGPTHGVMNDLRDAGFDVSDTGSLPDCFLVVRARLPLRPYHLHRLTNRLTRLIESYAGIAFVDACGLADSGLHPEIAA